MTNAAVKWWKTKISVVNIAALKTPRTVARKSLSIRWD